MFTKLVPARWVRPGRRPRFHVEPLEGRHLLSVNPLDLTFGSGGLSVTDVAGNTDNARALAPTADGGWLVAGQAYQAGNYDFALVRYDAHGSLDTSFGTNGRVTTPIGTSDEYAYAVAVQADGRILLAGTSYGGVSTSFNFALARYLDNGTLDTSFGSGGTVVLDLGGWEDAQAMTLQADGKIVVAGTSNGQFAVVRLNVDGSYDTTFGQQGVALTSLGFGYSMAHAVLVQPDGKIVAAGTNDSDFVVVRYLADGSLDSTFSGDGIAAVSFVGGRDRAWDLGLQSDGRLLVAGWSSTSFTEHHLAVARFNTDGSLDTSFGQQGKQSIQVGALADAQLSLAVGSDDRYVIAGRNGRTTFVVWSRADGTIQETYTASGTLNGFTATGAAFDGQGRTVLAGTAGGGFLADLAITRLNTPAGNHSGSTGFSTVGIVHQGETLTLTGSPAADTILVVFYSPTQFWVSAGNQLRLFDTTQVSRIIIDGRGGVDTLSLSIGTLGGSSTVIVGSDTLQLIAENITLTAGQLENSFVFGKGSDLGYFIDSAGDDVLYTFPQSSIMVGPGSFDQLIGFNQIQAYSVVGGRDTAFLYDSAGDDHFYALPGAAIMSGAGFMNQALGFATNIALASAGYDQATLVGSADPDVFYGTPSTALLLSQQRYQEAAGFDAAFAFANGDDDQAYLYDSPGDDIFYGLGNGGLMQGHNFLRQGIGFLNTTAYGYGGGRDQAYFFMGQGDSSLVAYGSFAQVATSLGLFSLYGFDHIAADATDDSTGVQQVGAIDFVLQLSGRWSKG